MSSEKTQPAILLDATQFAFMIAILPILITSFDSLLNAGGSISVVLLLVIGVIGIPVLVGIAIKEE